MSFLAESLMWACGVIAGCALFSWLVLPRQYKEHWPAICCLCILAVLLASILTNAFLPETTWSY